jgi:hypothetical protein
MTDAAIRAIAEAVVELLVERGVVTTYATTFDGRVLSAAEAARFLGRRRQWVYAHAAELGGIRYGTGRRARLGFDRLGLERYKHDHQLARLAPRPRRPPPGGSPKGANLIPFEPMSKGRSIGPPDAA